MTKPLCIYHGNCADGFGAAWAVWKYFKGEVDFVAGVYQEMPPDCTKRDVIICDFSYKPMVMKIIMDSCNTLLWIDHHKSAIEDMQPAIKDANCKSNSKLHFVLDMERSGAMITWNHFFPDQEPPQLLKHIQDRDLWQFKLEGTEDIQASLFSFPYDFEVWDYLTLGDCSALRNEGKAITRKHHKDIDELVKVTKRRMSIAGHDVPVANLPYTLSSDAGHLMGKDEPFAACYWDTPQGRVFSLRSSEEGQDVSEIAKKYGGGGHKHASGFRMPIGWEGDSSTIPVSPSTNWS